MLNWVRSLFRAIGSFFAWIFSRPEERFQLQRSEEVDKDKLKPFVLYVECRGGKDRWAHFLCPCGCKDVISLNLMTSQRPCWTLSCDEDGTVSLYPSVDKTSGCKSHFFVKKSKIDWAGAPVTS
jgi:hypothetical protein